MCLVVGSAVLIGGVPMETGLLNPIRSLAAAARGGRMQAGKPEVEDNRGNGSFVVLLMLLGLIF